MMRQLLSGGFEGEVAAVNPKWEEVEGVACYPSLNEIPFDVDLAILGIPNSILEEQLRAVADMGIESAVIFASGYEGDPSDSSLISRLKAICANSGITICGGNCMGFINFDQKLRALAFEEPPDMEPGGISWITHSGSAFTALLHNDRHLRFNLAVSAGQEFTTTVSDYMRYAVQQPSTGVIALFIETVRDPDGFRAALLDAAAADIPVVALKVGREEQAQRLVEAHSGALAGEDGVYDALFDSHGVMRVKSFNEMGDTLELLSAKRRATAGGLTAIHDSGGERAHLIDAAAEVGIPFAEISDATIERLRAGLEPGLPAVNPLDAWGTGNDFESIFLECMRALLADGDAGALAFVVDLAGEDLEWGYANVAERVFSESEKPMAVVSNLAAAIDPNAASRLRAAGVPVLVDTFNGLRAFRHLFDYRDFRNLAPVDAGPPVWARTHERWVERLGRPQAWDEVETLQMLGSYGLPVAPSRTTSGIDEAVDAADEFGYPVALKITGSSHKSDEGGVRVAIEDEQALARAHRTMTERFEGVELVVQKMAEPGIEMALGLVHDDQFGPVVILASGGVFIEVLRDRALALPPLDEARALRMIDRLASRRLLDGVRGGKPADVAALAEAIARFSLLALDLGDHIAALDVNPIIVGPKGCTIVDALLIPKLVPRPIL
jgi:acyl-CoA synthetase (NDP forming)